MQDVPLLVCGVRQPSHDKRCCMACDGHKNSKDASWPYPFVIIHQAAPVPHLHHGCKAEDGLLVQAATHRHSESPGSQLDWLVSLSPGKLLLPYL